MSITPRAELRTVFRTTRSLTPTQRLVVLAYAAMEPDDESGAVLKSGVELAEEAGLNMRLFSKARRDVVELGFLAEVPELRDRVTRVYRLTAKALDREAGTSPVAA